MDAPVVLITGCSTGIGQATACLLAASGWSVVATARESERLQIPGAALGLRLDVTEEASIDEALRQTLARFGRIDALVSNAGFAVRGAVEELDIADVDRLFDVNVNALIRLVRQTVPAMRERGKGRIVVVGSIAGRLSLPANGAYSASKHAVEALGDAMRWELRPFGIDVVLVEPGNIGTAFAATALRASNRRMSRGDSPYATLYESFLRAASRQRAHEPGPEAVARVIFRALRTRHPRARYAAAVPFSTRLAIALPDWARDPVMRRIYGLKRPLPKRKDPRS